MLIDNKSRKNSTKTEHHNGFVSKEKTVKRSAIKKAKLKIY